MRDRVQQTRTKRGRKSNASHRLTCRISAPVTRYVQLRLCPPPKKKTPTVQTGAPKNRGLVLRNTSTFALHFFPTRQNGAGLAFGERARRRKALGHLGFSSRCTGTLVGVSIARVDGGASLVFFFLQTFHTVRSGSLVGS